METENGRGCVAAVRRPEYRKGYRSERTETAGTRAENARRTRGRQNARRPPGRKETEGATERKTVGPRRGPPEKTTSGGTVTPGPRRTRMAEQVQALRALNNPKLKF